MKNNYLAKSYIEETILGANSDGMGFINESFYKAHNAGLRFNTNYVDEIVSVGILDGGVLEIGVNKGLFTLNKMCNCIKNDLCRKLSLNGAFVQVLPKARYQAQLKLPLGGKVAHHNLAVDAGYGTLGGFILPGGSVGDMHIVSNNHVLADCNNAYIGDDVYYMGGIRPVKIGTLKNYVPIDANRANKLDLAVAEISGFSNDGSLKAGMYRKAILGEVVYKNGATTGATYGRVRSLNYTTKIDYPGFSAVFIDQLQVSSQFGAFSQPGDSGSVIKASADGKHVGLLFGGNGVWTVANHHTDVASQLKEWFN